MPNSFVVVSETDFFAGRYDFSQLIAQQNEIRDARFLMADQFQAPRAARITLKWSF